MNTLKQLSEKGTYCKKHREFSGWYESAFQSGTPQASLRSSTLASVAAEAYAVEKTKLKTNSCIMYCSKAFTAQR